MAPGHSAGTKSCRSPTSTTEHAWGWAAAGFTTLHLPRSPHTQTPATPSYFLVLGDGPDHTNPHGHVQDRVLRRGRLHGGPAASCRAPEESAGGRIRGCWGGAGTLASRGTGVGLPTFGVTSVDSFPDQGLPLPERHPQEVVGPTADLDSLPRGVHKGPR